MQYIQTSSKNIQEIIKTIQEIATKHKFTVLNVRDIKETLASKGFSLKEECFVLDICNANFAHTLLTQDLLLSSILPCKISIYSQKGQTTVVMNSLVQQIDDINPDFIELAQEAQKSLQTIIDEAI
ncbi:MAG: DUF302 domain-containing protein [Arcobacteraceae bacterium]